jgi:hypothetical protein
MSERNFTEELSYIYCPNFETGEDIESIDYPSLIRIITELHNRVEQLEKGEEPKEMTGKQKLEFLLTEIKSTAKRKTCYEHGNLYEYPDDYDATFDDGDRYGKIMFSRDLLERMGESYE